MKISWERSWDSHPRRYSFSLHRICLVRWVCLVSSRWQCPPDGRPSCPVMGYVMCFLWPLPCAPCSRPWPVPSWRLCSVSSPAPARPATSDLAWSSTAAANASSRSASRVCVSLSYWSVCTSNLILCNDECVWKVSVFIDKCVRCYACMCVLSVCVLLRVCNIRVCTDECVCDSVCSDMCV